MIRRVAHIVENLNQGGIARVVLSLASEMHLLGVHTDILTLDHRVQFEPDPHIGIRQISIIGLTASAPSYGRIVRKVGRALLGRRAFWHLASGWFCRQMQQYVTVGGYDCVFFHGLPVCWPFHRWSWPNGIFVLHNLKSLQVSADTAAWEYRLYRKTLLNKQLVAVSETVRQDAIENFGVNPAAIATIYNPVDFDTIQAKTEPYATLPASALTAGYVLFVGRLVREKRVDLLLQAFAKAKIPEHLLVLGQGPIQAELEGLMERLSLAGRVHFLGFIENPYPYMRHAKALVLPSKFEGFGLVIVEALACGTSVISTRTGPAEEIMVGPLAAGLIASGDEAGLIEKLHAASHGRLPVADRDYLRRFDKRLIAERYLDLAERVLGAATGFERASNDIESAPK